MTKKAKIILGGCLALPFAVVAAVFVMFLIACTPTKMKRPPSDEQIGKWIASAVHVEPTQLRFVGGVSAREPTVIFEVVGPHPEWKVRVEDEANRKRLVARFRHLAERYDIAFAISDGCIVSTHDGEWGTVYVVQDGLRLYLVFFHL